jgi:hypothetical protein
MDSNVGVAIIPIILSLKIDAILKKDKSRVLRKKENFWNEKSRMIPKELGLKKEREMLPRKRRTKKESLKKELKKEEWSQNHRLKYETLLSST